MNPRTSFQKLIDSQIAPVRTVGLLDRDAERIVKVCMAIKQMVADRITEATESVVNVGDITQLSLSELDRATDRLLSQAILANMFGDGSLWQYKLMEADIPLYCEALHDYEKFLAETLVVLDQETIYEAAEHCRQLRKVLKGGVP